MGAGVGVGEGILDGRGSGGSPTPPAVALPGRFWVWRFPDIQDDVGYAVHNQKPLGFGLGVGQGFPKGTCLHLCMCMRTRTGEGPPFGSVEGGATRV